MGISASKLDTTSLSLGKAATSSSKSATVTVAGYTSADLPGMTFFAVDANIDLSAYGRFKVYADKNGACKVRIIACGRSL